ncbi:hypothetical protein RAA17_24380 [Komagataeibacter rhaeticus]|nr:hypothetical protein [Komagataeibacter rhaeticus]
MAAGDPLTFRAENRKGLLLSHAILRVNPATAYPKRGHESALGACMKEKATQPILLQQSQDDLRSFFRYPEKLMKHSLLIFLLPMALNACAQSLSSPSPIATTGMANPELALQRSIAETTTDLRELGSIRPSPVVASANQPRSPMT